MNTVDGIGERESAAGTVETKAEYLRSPKDFVAHWMKAIELAGDEEKDWRAQAEETLKRYAGSKLRSFNVLYANTRTTVPALYNSAPAPDVRRRFGDTDPDGVQFARMLERALSIQAEMYGFNETMKAAVLDRQLQGRGVTRVRVCEGGEGSRWVQAEPVAWDDFRRGPAKSWPDVPWVAFRHKMTREELIELSPTYGEKVPLDVAIGEKAKDGGKELPDPFKRSQVWEVWDKAERLVYFIAESFADAPLKVVPDPYRLRAFLPMPKPLYQVERTETLVPVCEFMLWKHLADEVDNLTHRISGIVKVMKLRGLYAGHFAALMDKLKGLDDGELAAADDSARAMQEGGIERAIWLWPVEKAMVVVKGLYEAREQAKNHLYELTGVADILRGQTKAGETLGAQRIKAQWGSLRMQDGQQEVANHSRDLFRLMADLMGEVMEPAQLAAMTGISMTPQQAVLLKADMQREFQIEIETDSTIRADLSRAQENIAGFIAGFGQFIQAVGPAVQAGMLPPTIAVKLATSFARHFKLGREAEDAMDEWGKFLEQKAQQPPQPDPKQQAEQIRAQAETTRAQADIAKTQLDAKASADEHGQRMQQMQMEGQIAVVKHGMDMQKIVAQRQTDLAGARLWDNS